MTMSAIESALLNTLAEGYERDPRGYVALSKETVDSSEARVIVADMRNQGYVDEQMRGVVRLTLRGYKVYRNRLLISA
jgi:Mn-dependent DtxR family transcriptional regulator